MKNILIAVFLFVPSFALADVHLSPSAVPTNLHIYNQTGLTYVDHVAQHCSSKRYFIDPSHRAYDHIVSILISAQVAGRKVVLRYDGCVNKGTQGKIIGVYLGSKP